MKTVIIILVTLFSQISFSQDLITFKDGSVKSVNVKEISETEVKYQKPENTSVMYSVLKTSLFSVQFKNGDKEVFNQPVAVVTPQVIAPPTKNVAIVEQPKPKKAESIAKAPTPTVIPEIEKPSPKPATVTFKSGTVKTVNVTEITDTEVKYSKSENSNTIYSVLKTDLLSVQYKNGEKAILDAPVISPQVKTVPVAEETITLKSENVIQAIEKPKAKQATVSESTVLTKREYSDMFQQGKNDAKIYYQGYKGAGTGTFLVSLLGGPILGLIPAIACSSTAPSSNNLSFPNIELTRNPDYINGYTAQAKAKKSSKVWGNFGIGTGILIAIVASQYKSIR